MTTFPDARPLATPLAAAALDLVENMLVITDRRGRIVYVNPAFTAVTGYTQAEALGQTPRLLRSGMQDDGFYAGLWTRILAGETWNGEVVNRKKDGTLYTDRMTITPLRDPDGAIRHFVAVKRDVSGYLAALTADNPGGIAHVDATGRLVYANERLSELLERPFDDLLGQGWLAALGTAAADQVMRDLGRLDRRSDLVAVVVLADGRSLRVHYAPLGVGQAAAGVVATLEDVTTERDALRRLAEREAYARAILESLGTPTAVVDGAGVIRQVNRAWRDRAEAAGADPHASGVGADYPAVCRRSAAAGCEDAAAVGAALDAVLTGRSVHEAVDYHMDGPATTWWELRIAALEVEGGGAVLTHSDITLRHEVQLLLQEQARTDPLTGLANRTGLLQHGAGALARARRSGGPVTVVFLDLDRFKAVNDAFGHDAGDEVLRSCALRLQSLVRDTDCVARVGGDEFVVVCEGVRPTDVAPLELRIAAAIEEPIDVGATVTVGASTGAVRVAGEGDFAQAVADADARMYAAKRARQSAR